MNIEDKLTDEEQAELYAARANDRDKFTRVLMANSESDDIAELRVAYRNLEEVVRRICPDGRRKSVALTELETSQMYAVKSAYEKHEDSGYD